MRCEVVQGHRGLPSAPALELAVLVKLESSGVSAGPVAQALHVGMCLDTSGSMGEAAGLSGGLTKLDALKAAVQAVLPLLEQWGATVTLSAFSDVETKLCQRQVLQPGASAALAQAVEALDVQGGTGAKTAMGPVLKALEPHDHAVRRLVLVTDGQFNSDSVKPCRALAQHAGAAGVALWAFATGTSYNEDYLRELVSLAAPGGMFAHVSDLGLLRQHFQDELGAVATAAECNIALHLRPGAGCQVLEVLRLTPVQVALPVGPGSEVKDRLDVLDARGQAYVVRLAARNLPPGTQPVLLGQLTWTETGRAREQQIMVNLDVLPAGSALPAPDAQVLTTVLSAKAAQATLLGHGALATQLYAAAGQTGLSTRLAALGTALPKDSDAARALRTEALGSTRLVALGSALPKGGQP